MFSKFSDFFAAILIVFVGFLPSSASALSGTINSESSFGTGVCTYRNYTNGTGANVNIRTLFVIKKAGGSFYSNVGGAIEPDSPVTVAFLENTCGFTNVTNLEQNGAESTLASDSEISVTFVGNTARGRYAYDIGLYGVTSTIGRFTETLIKAAPTVTLSGMSGTITSTQTITVSFGEAVTGLTESDFVLAQASVVPGSLVYLGANVYSLSITPTATGTVTITLPAGAVQDSLLIGNLSSNRLSATADITPPTVTGLTGLPATVYTGIPSTVTATFSEPVTGFALADLALIGASVSNFVPVNSTNYKFDVTPTGGGSVSVRVKLLAVSDSAGNLNSLAGPTITAANAGLPTPIAASFAVSPATGLVTPHFAFFTDTTTPTSGESLTSWSWNFGDGSTSNQQNPLHSYGTEGTFNVTLQACDPIGCSTATGTVTVSAALATLTATLSGLTGTITAPQTVTVVFSNDLDDALLGGLTLTDFATTNLTLSALTLVSSGPLATSPETFTLTATPNGDGPVSISLPASKVQNRAAVANAASNTLSGAADTTPPTVTLSSTSPYVGPILSVVTATFSEPVSGLTIGDISASNLTVSNVTPTADPAVYSIGIRTRGNGAANLQIGAAAVLDTAGNGNIASNTLNLTADSIRPTASFLDLPATVYTGIPKTITVNFSEPVTGFVLTDIVRNAATLSNFTKVDDTNYTFVLTPTGATNVSVAVSAGSFFDLAQNSNSLDVGPVRATNAGAATLISASFTVVPDLGTSVPHSVAFTDTTSPTSGETITSWSWTFGDGSTSNAQHPVHNYTTAGIFAVTLQACDAGGCSTANGSVTVSTTLATLTPVLSGLSGLINAPQTITVVFSNDLDNTALGGLTLSDFATTNLTLSALTLVSSGPLATSPKRYSLTATANGDGPVSISLPAATVKNRAGVANTASNSLNATADATAPTVVLSGLPAIMFDIPKTVTATFSESVSGFTAAKVFLSGGSLSNFVSVDSLTYRFDVTANAGGSIVLLINSGVVSDAAGNGNILSNELNADGFGPATPIAAGFTFAPILGLTTPHNVTFTDTTTPTSGETITSWAWDFGDGGTSSAQNPVHTYTTNGVFAITLQACDAGGCSTANGSVRVATGLAALNATLSGFSGVVNGAQTVTLVVDNQIDPSALGGLTLSDFVTTNLTLSNLVQTVAGTVLTDTQTYTFTATPNGGGAISVSLPAGVVANLAATQNTVSNTLAGTQNGAPVAAAGLDQVVASGVLVTLDGSGSTDPDANPLTYSWAAPASITLSDASAQSPTFTAPTLNPGDADSVLSFTVTVSDGLATTQDTVQITVRAGVLVTLSGLPAEISGPGNHTVSIAFSRAVTGFVAADIVVTGGSVSSLSGSGSAYSAVIAASGTGDLSVSIPASIAADANSIGNAASNVVAAVNVLGVATSKEIAHFLQTRTNALLTNQPDLAGFLRGGAGQFAAEVTRGGGTVAFDSGYSAPIWARLNANWSTDLGAESQYVFGVIGGHSKLSQNLLLGGMLQFDHLRETNGAATTQGTGWLLGPYFVAKLPAQSLYFEGSLLYGQTANTVSPLGTYTDAFSTERWLATLGVSGAIERGNLTMLPFLDAKYTSDSQAAYVDGLSNPIAAQTIGLAQVSAGLDLEVALSAATTLKAGASGTWSYSSGSAIAAGYEGGRARLSFGLAHRFGACSGLDISGFYDGIGAVDFESYGAGIKWEMCF